MNQRQPMTRMDSAISGPVCRAQPRCVPGYARGAAAALAAFLCLQSGAAPDERDAAQPPSETPEAVRYTVEVIVFTYGDDGSAGNEVFAPPQAVLPDNERRTAPDGEVPVFADTLPSDIAGDRSAGETALREVPARARIEMQRLAPENFLMQDTYRKLSSLDAYRPILHAAWTQTTQEKALSPALPLRSLSDPPLGLDGTIRLYQSRFLHLDVELTLDAAQETLRGTATDRLIAGTRNHSGAQSPDESVAESAVERIGPPVRYRIAEDRIMHAGDVRYFDHPRFGMLARVTRTDAENSAAEAGRIDAGE